jgi:hypothetical protein
MVPRDLGLVRVKEGASADHLVSAHDQSIHSMRR